VVRAVYTVPDLELVRESGESGRAATIVSTPELERLLFHVFESVGGVISLSQLDRAFRDRFAWAFEARTLALEETPVEEIRSEELPTAFAANETALAIMVDLTRRQLEMLRARAEGATLEQLADAHACSRGTADNELRRAADIIRHHVAQDDEQERILEILLSLSFPERG
jgi:DNA-binding CsgD family transcriptional regulator